MDEGVEEVEPDDDDEDEDEEESEPDDVLGVGLEGVLAEPLLDGLVALLDDRESVL